MDFSPSHTKIISDDQILNFVDGNKWLHDMKSNTEQNKILQNMSPQQKLEASLSLY